VFEYTMWQTLVGAWPLASERAQQFAEKATREARLRTSWRRPDAAYEAARTRWLAAVYADAALVAEIAAFAASSSPTGDRNSLAQLLIKLTVPGVPDFYQAASSSTTRSSIRQPPAGRSRRRARRLRELGAAADAPAEVARIGGELGAAKLWTIRCVLALRRRAPELWRHRTERSPHRDARAPRVRVRAGRRAGRRGAPPRGARPGLARYRARARIWALARRARRRHRRRWRPAGRRSVAGDADRVAGARRSVTRPGAGAHGRGPPHIAGAQLRDLRISTRPSGPPALAPSVNYLVP